MDYGARSVEKVYVASTCRQGPQAVFVNPILPVGIVLSMIFRVQMRETIAPLFWNLGETHHEVPESGPLGVVACVRHIVRSCRGPFDSHEWGRELAQIAHCYLDIHDPYSTESLDSE